MALGATISELRKKRGLKQYTLAEKCGITQTYLSQIEHDKKEPNLSTLREISNALDLPLPVIFYLSLNSKEISPNKQEAFKLFDRSMRGMIDDIFLAPNQAKNDSV